MAPPAVARLVNQRKTIDASYKTVLHLSQEHPSLPGHFPDQPLVPGVVVLEHVAYALREWRNQRLVRVREVKFLSPWHPNEHADLELTDSAGQLGFELRREGVVLARGVIEGTA